MDYVDNLWHGIPEDTAVVIVNQPNVIGPKVLDGIAYANIRTEEALEVPEFIQVTGPQLSAAIVGVWAGAVVESGIVSDEPVAEPVA